MKRSAPAGVAALALASVALGGCGRKQELQQLPGPPTPVIVSLGGPPGAVVAPLYSAAALGDFARAGLAVTLQTSTGGSQSLARLESGTVNLAVASEPDLLVARARGAQLVSIATLEQGPLEGLISIPPTPIPTVSALTGKTVATDGSALAKAELATLLRTAGVEASAVHPTTVPTDPAAQLKSHKAEAILAGWTTDAVALGLQHHKPTVIKIAGAGVPTYNDDVLVARLTDARNHGELLRTFLQALTQAVRAEQAAPAQAVAALTTAVPGLDRRLELASLQATLPILDPAGSGNPFGYQNPAVWRTFASWMLTNGLLTVRSDAALGVDDEFLPGEGE
jgi:ABC-type nitrate/sulfonate/bicarbonate transport system substrate-binding protein